MRRCSTGTISGIGAQRTSLRVEQTELNEGAGLIPLVLGRNRSKRLAVNSRLASQGRARVAPGAADHPQQSITHRGRASAGTRATTAGCGNRHGLMSAAVIGGEIAPLHASLQCRTRVTLYDKRAQTRLYSSVSGPDVLARPLHRLLHTKHGHTVTDRLNGGRLAELARDRDDKRMPDV